MRATKFEYGHQALLHLLLVGLSSLSYLYDRVDIVWLMVRNHSDSASWERFVFGFGALMLVTSAVLETWANAHNQVSVGPNGSAVVVQSQHGSNRRELRLARILLVLTIGLLLPLPGTIILLAGETILMLRLFFHSDESASHVLLPPGCSSVCWRSGLRVAASKWGLTASMIAFVWTLQDRIAEIGAACSVVLWLLLNARPRKQ